MKRLLSSVILVTTQATQFDCNKNPVVTDLAADMGQVRNLWNPAHWTSDPKDPWKVNLYEYLVHLDEQNLKILSYLGTPEDNTSIGQMGFDLSVQLSEHMQTKMDELMSKTDLSVIRSNNVKINTKLNQMYHKFVLIMQTLGQQYVDNF